VTGRRTRTAFRPAAGERVIIEHAHTGSACKLTAGRYGKTLMRHLDGKRTLREIFGNVRSEPEFKEAHPRIAAAREFTRYLRRLRNRAHGC